MIILIHFGRNTRNGGSPPKDNSDVNIMNFITGVSLFVIMVWLMNDAPESLIADTTAGASVEWIVKYTIHKFLLVVSEINIHPVWLMEE
jgi:hypothetical protein